jgi:hypothetical protein
MFSASTVRVFVLGLVASTLSACGGFPTTHPDPAKNTPANYKADLQACTQSYPETADGIYLKRRIACLEIKGWK